MDALRKLPVAFSGVLHQVKLVAFSVPVEEVTPFLPGGIEPVVKEGRALFSLVSVELEQMKADLFPIPFSYHHVALRMCVKDHQFNDSGKDQGVYFFASFTDKPFIVAGGKLLTAYNLEMAEIKKAAPVFELKSKKGSLRFALDCTAHKIGDQQLYEQIKRLDRAYFSSGGSVYRTVITRKKWPIRWAECYAFETDLFSDVKVEGAFYIDHPIHYRWNKPEKMANTL